MSLASRHALALASAESEVPIDVAATLICEATLLLERLARRRLRDPATLLDRAAGAGRVGRALSAANADYLRALSCRSWRRHHAELDVPVRVLSQISDGLEARLARDDLLERAIDWEIGALLSGRSMATWGAGAVLAGFR